MENLKVKNVQRIAWNLERVELSNEAMDVTINIKDPKLHGAIKSGDSVDDLFVEGNDAQLRDTQDLLNAAREENEDLKKQLATALAPK